MRRVIATPVRSGQDSTMTSHAHPAQDIARPEWLAHRYEPGNDAVHFVQADRAMRAQLTFVTDEYLPQDLPRLVVSRADSIALTPDPAPVHFIFHSAFCCSTLMAAALDYPGAASSLKEPVILNDLAGWGRSGVSAPLFHDVLGNSLSLLARPFAEGEAMVVKPSSVLNPLAPTIMAARPQARAILMHAPLRDFLISVAKKGLDGRIWVRTLCMNLLKDRLVQRLGFDDEQLFGQTDLQIAALVWLAQHALFADMIAQLGSDRCKSLSSDDLLRDPARTITAASAHFTLGLTETAIADIISTVFQRNSKSGAQFGTAEREREYRDAAGAYSDEIKKVAIWGQAVADAAGIPITLDAPLK